MQKDFSQKSMVSRENAFKKRPPKVHYLGNFLGHFSKAFSLENIDFCEKSFCTAVSRYNMSHMSHMNHMTYTFEKKGATLVTHESLSVIID